MKYCFLSTKEVSTPLKSVRALTLGKCPIKKLKNEPIFVTAAPPLGVAEPRAANEEFTPSAI